ncbi:MAG: Tim44/TimA family putative adaptor protein [Alphaproteobacteria bacterium]
MGDEFTAIQVLFLAGLAVFIFFQLRRVLGRRTGNERQRDPFAARTGLGTPGRAGEADTPPPLTGRANPEDTKTRIGAIAPEGSELNQALTEIQLADRSFDLDRFLSGARAAYRVLAEAFAAGDKATLKPLLSDEVFQSFSAVIDGRAGRGEAVDFKLLGVKDATITAAKLEGKQAEITVSFESEISTATKDKEGRIIAGDPSTVVTVIDIWTFSRDVKSKSPDWALVATDTAE